MMNKTEASQAFHGVPLRGRIEARYSPVPLRVSFIVLPSTEFPSVAALKPEQTGDDNLDLDRLAFHGVPLRGRIEACITTSRVAAGCTFHGVPLRGRIEA